jgi:cytochrome c-type biogenesis protein CcmH/NrfG
MDNQDQHSEEILGNQSPDPAEFSTRRRIFTAVLVLVAALLLGYVMYTYTIEVSPQPVDNQAAMPVEQEVDREELAIIRLEALKDQVTETPTDASIERLKAIQEENITPTQEQLMRLEALGDGS